MGGLQYFWLALLPKMTLSSTKPSTSPIIASFENPQPKADDVISEQPRIPICTDAHT